MFILNSLWTSTRRGELQAACSIPSSLLDAKEYPVRPPRVEVLGSTVTHPNVFSTFICLDMLEGGEWASDEEPLRCILKAGMETWIWVVWFKVLGPGISRLTIVMWYSAFCIHVNQTPTRHVLGTQDFSSPKSITRQSVPVGFDLVTNGCAV